MVNSILKLILFCFFIKTNVLIHGPIYSHDGIGRLSIDIAKIVGQSHMLPESDLWGNPRIDIDNEDKKIENKILNNIIDHNFYISTIDINRLDNIFLEKFINQHPRSIKISYCMGESQIIDKDKIKVLNNFFDLVIVLSSWLENIFITNGLDIPIISIGLPISIDIKLNDIISKKDRKTFFYSAGPWTRKNHINLIKAFDIFSKNKNVELILHIRFFDKKNRYCQEVEKLAAKNKKIKLIKKIITKKDYYSLINNSDIIIQPSSGEGYSILPREAILLQKPILISENTGHTELINYDSVVKIKSERTVNSYNVKIVDILYALEYSLKNLKNLNKFTIESKNKLNIKFQEYIKNFQTLIYPTKIHKFDKLIIDNTDGYLFLNDNLYKKYKLIYDHL